MDLPLDAAITQFGQDLRLDKSPRTIESYTESARLYARANPEVRDVTQITAESIRSWLVSQRDAGRTRGTVFARQAGMKAFLRWAVSEGLITENPMANMASTQPPAPPIPVMSLDDVRALLATCGTDFNGLRDEAIIRVLVDTGIRRGELAGLKGRLREDGTFEGDIDFDHDTLTVLGKGGRVRTVPFGARTARSLRRYLRARYAHSYATEAALWLGRSGPLEAATILTMLRRRGEAAGLDGVFVHRFRHTWASEALSSGLQEGDVQRLGGWRSRAMLDRYGATAADDRARAAYRRNSVGDRV